MQAEVHALIASIWIPWPMGTASKVCKHLTEGNCPLKPNTKAIYEYTMKIPAIAPIGTKTTVELKIRDDDDNVVTCTRFPVLVSA